jgi:hypothetical protein
MLPIGGKAALTASAIMAHSTKPPPRANEPPRRARHTDATTAAAAEEAPPRQSSRWQALGSIRWLVAVAAIVLVVDAVVVIWHHSKGAAPESPLSNEIALGTFDFNRSNARDNRAYRGQFDLSIRLADNLSPVDRRRVADERPQLQRAAEEALWRLRPVDFSDRRLTRLKDRLQQQLNDELGFEAVAEVLVSNFTIEPRALAPTAPPRRGISADPKPSE